IAGPTGGTESKPVGMVCSAVRIGDLTKTYTDTFRGDRETVQLRGASTVLKRLWRLFWNEFYIE
ncbi:hypothetical protein BG32_16055, partial [Mesotoga sp. HF07.pep.5.2.highcov]